MKPLSRQLPIAALLAFCGAALAGPNAEPNAAPTSPSASMGPSSGAHSSSQTTPSLKEPGKAAFGKLDTDKDGTISEAEAAGDAKLAQSFGLSDENKDKKIDSGEFSRSMADGSPASTTPAVKP